MKKLLYFLIIIIALGSCNVGGTWTDNNIDKETRNEIKKLNEQIFNGFFENNPDKIFQILSDSARLIFKKEDLNKLVQHISSNFSKEKFKMKNEFYTVSTTIGSYVTVMTRIYKEHDYKINYKVHTNETYVFVGYFDDDVSETSLVFMYGKYNNGWKLNSINIGFLTKLKKDAYDWFKLSKDLYNKGYLYDAANNYILANLCLQPGAQGWQYQKEKEILDYGEKLKADIYKYYSFPIYIESIKSTPGIFQVYPEISKEWGMAPIVEYVSKIPQIDTTKLSKECDEIHSKIGNIFIGLDKNNKYIIYRAFDKIPNGKYKVSAYGFIRENKQ